GLFVLWEKVSTPADRRRTAGPRCKRLRSRGPASRRRSTRRGTQRRAVGAGRRPRPTLGAKRADARAPLRETRDLQAADQQLALEDQLLGQVVAQLEEELLVHDDLLAPEIAVDLHDLVPLLAREVQ